MQVECDCLDITFLCGIFFIMKIWIMDFLNKSNETGTELKESVLFMQPITSRLPLIIFLSIFLVVGFVLNVFTLTVLLKCFPACALKSYLCTMTFTDLICVTIGLPLHIFYLVQPYEYEVSILCKIGFAVINWSAHCSSFIIVILAVDRYRRVHVAVSIEADRKRSLALVGVATFLSSVLTCPFIHIHGLYKVSVSFNDGSATTVSMCWIKNEYSGSIYASLHTALLCITFFIGMCLVVGSYSMIALLIHQLVDEIKESIVDELINPPPKPALASLYSDASEIITMINADGDMLKSALKAQFGEGRNSFALDMDDRPRPSAWDIVRASIESRTNKKTMLRRIINAFHKMLFLTHTEISLTVSTFISDRAPNSFASTSRPLPRLSSLIMSKKVKRPDYAESPVSLQNVHVLEKLELPQTKKHNCNVDEICDAIPIKNNYDECQTADVDTTVSEHFKAQKTAHSSFYQTPVTSPSPKLSGSVTHDRQKAVDMFNIHWSRNDATATKQIEKIALDRRRSTRSMIRVQVCLNTLRHLETIKSLSTKVMMTLVVVYLITWMPYVIAR